MIQKIGIEEFLTLAKKHPVLDVRSPGEYVHAHIPGAYNLPLFSDEERKVVGTLYKQKSRQQAIKTGLDYFGPKMTKMVEEVEQIIHDRKTTTPIPDSQSQIPILLHCWRGGMRSAGVAWLLDLYGFKVYTLNGGYKAYRNWALQQFEKPYHLQIIGGYTGTGKTEVLKALSDRKYLTIDLEGLACHKGSAFGAMGEEKQPTQEMFENKLAQALFTSSEIPGNDPVFVEDESQRIGLVNLPNAFWNTMRRATVYFLDVPFEERLNYLTAAYGKFKKDELVTAIMRIQKRLGGLNTKNAINFLLEDNCKESFRILLRYYDKYYAIGLYDRDVIKERLHSIVCQKVDTKTNTANLIAQIITHGNTNTGN